MLLVDVMLPQLSVLRANKIRRSGEGSKFVNLSEKTKPGGVITVRIENIDTTVNGRGVEGKNNRAPLTKLRVFGASEVVQPKPGTAARTRF